MVICAIDSSVQQGTSCLCSGYRYFIHWQIAYTPCLKKNNRLLIIHLTFDHNFCKCIPIFKILSLSDSPGNYLCNYYRVFHLTLTVLLHSFSKFKNRKLQLYFHSYHQRIKDFVTMRYTNLLLPLPLPS